MAEQKRKKIIKEEISMKKHIKLIALAVAMITCLFVFAACDSDTIPAASRQDQQNQRAVADTLAAHQKTPTDINYSLERYNLIRRTYWVNGMREKANALPCEVEKPLGYIVLFAGNTVVERFVVDGKVSSLNSYLTPDSEYYELNYGGSGWSRNEWLADVDGTYGENDNGIFFFTPNGNYIEWTGEYLYSDIPFEVESPVVKYEVTNNGQ